MCQAQFQQVTPEHVPSQRPLSNKRLGFAPATGEMACTAPATSVSIKALRSPHLQRATYVSLPGRLAQRPEEVSQGQRAWGGTRGGTGPSAGFLQGRWRTSCSTLVGVLVQRRCSGPHDCLKPGRAAGDACHMQTLSSADAISRASGPQEATSQVLGESKLYLTLRRAPDP